MAKVVYNDKGEPSLFGFGPFSQADYDALERARYLRTRPTAVIHGGYSSSYISRQSNSVDQSQSKELTSDNLLAANSEIPIVYGQRIVSGRILYCTVESK